MLSPRVKEVLIKAVDFSMPTYSMNVFLFPLRWCREVTSLISKFGRASAKKDDRIHWKAWSTLAKSKDERGLGFRDLHLFNLSFLGKLSWQILQEPDALQVRFIKSMYFPNEDLLCARKGGTTS